MRKLRHFFVFSTVIAALMTSGCATIAAGGSDKVQVNTKPDGANVYLNGQYIGKTPLVATLGRKDDAVFRFEKEGYETKTVDSGKVVNGWVFGNVLLGGVIGLSIDLITSNQGKHSESPIFVEMPSEIKRSTASAKK